MGPPPGGPVPAGPAGGTAGLVQWAASLQCQPQHPQTAAWAPGCRPPPHSYGAAAPAARPAPLPPLPPRGCCLGQGGWHLAAASLVSCAAASKSTGHGSPSACIMGGWATLLREVRDRNCPVLNSNSMVCNTAPAAATAQQQPAQQPPATAHQQPAQQPAATAAHLAALLGGGCACPPALAAAALAAAGLPAPAALLRLPLLKGCITQPENAAGAGAGGQRSRSGSVACRQPDDEARRPHQIKAIHPAGAAWSTSLHCSPTGCLPADLAGGAWAGDGRQPLAAEQPQLAGQLQRKMGRVVG